MNVFGMTKRLLFLLIALNVVALTAFGASKQFTLVIDAGHGGTDYGAPGAISNEKDLTLKYSLAFGEMVERNCRDVRVVYTRKTDIFIPLMQRARIANDNNADLFISFHINAVEGSRLVTGFQSWTLGSGSRTGDKGIRENLDVAKRENSVIFLEKDYKTTYKGFDANSAESNIMFEFIADKNRERSVELSRLMQQEVCKTTGRRDGGSHQNNLAVCRLTAMPSILLELGFISTPDEEQYLNTDVALDCFTRGIYNAFIVYKNKYDGYIDVPYRPSESSYTRQVDTPKVDTETRDTASRQQTAAKQPALRANTPKPVVASKPKEVKVPSAPSANIDNSKPVFKIQFLTSRYILKDGDKRFKGLEGCEHYADGNNNKYTFGSSNDYNSIFRLRKQVAELFPDCFIIAFKNGQRMDVNEGIREFKASR